jgi:hypothetical protein
MKRPANICRDRKETAKKIGKIINWIIQNGFDEFVDNIKEKI